MSCPTMVASSFFNIPCCKVMDAFLQLCKIVMTKSAEAAGNTQIFRRQMGINSIKEICNKGERFRQYRAKTNITVSWKYILRFFQGGIN